MRSEDIVKSKPVDSVAARVTSSGIQYQSSKTILELVSDAPLPFTTRVAKSVKHLVGLRCGRLVIVGRSTDRPKRWVVRCDCGSFTIRTSKAMKKKDNQYACCIRCQEMMYQRRVDEFRRLGQNFD